MSAKTSPLLLKIKKEVNEEIKEYAESAMNELLGWYGYCNSNNNDHSTERFNSLTNARMSTPNFAACLSQSVSYSSANNSTNSVCNAAPATAVTTATATTTNTVGANGNSNSIGRRANSLSMDDIDNTTDSMSTVDELTKMSPQMNMDAINSQKTITTTTAPEKSPLGSQSDECGWCKRVISFGSSEFSASSEGLKFCSESCFSQSRRASYKRAKTCDWCKHIRHAVSYVDFQDGASQLQFCSDKCLNQYKMQIFCKETQAHLDLNPHLKEKGKSSNDNLITPDLWMRNCRSPSRSLTPDQRSNDSRAATESPISITSTINAMPKIKVAPVSKLLSTESDATSRRHSKENESKTIELKNYSNFAQKSRALRKRRTIRSNSSSIMGNETINNNDSSNENRNIHGKIHASNMINDHSNRICLLQPSLMTNLPSSKISPLPANNQSINDEQPNAAFLQRYQLMSQQTPNLFAINENRSLQNALRQSAPFIAPLISNAGPPPPPVQLPPLSSSSSMPDAMSKIPPPNQQHPLLKFLPMQRQRSEPSAPSINAIRFAPENNPLFLMQQHQKSQALNDFVSHIFGTVTPPSTILMPYPIILPIPLPIPIPLPYEAFLKAANVKRNDAPYAKNVGHNCNSTNEEDDCLMLKNCQKSNASDQPLDFTKDNIANEVRKTSDDDQDDNDIDDENEEINCRSSSNNDNETHIRMDATKFRNNRQTTNKRSLLTKEPTSENNRPLRKRKRVIDCDYMRLRDSNSNDTTINPRKSI